MKRRYSATSRDRAERATVLGLFGLAVLVLLVARLFSLQVVSGDRYRQLAEKNWLRPEPLTGRRGRILDRGGRVLADVVPSYAVVIDPQHDAFRRHPEVREASITRLAALLGDDPEHYRQEVRKGERSSYQPVRLRRNADLTTISLVEEHRAELPGVTVSVDSRRYYPADTLAAHVLGYVGEVSSRDLERLDRDRYRPGSTIGRTGIEAEYEEVLRGTDGVRYVEVNVRGRRSEDFIRTKPVAPVPGGDLTLTLDADLQQAVEDALDHAPYDGRGEPPEVMGSAVVIDVRTGEVLAMASRPAFDPNLFSEGMSTETYRELNRPAVPLLNRCIQGSYPPGSTFKGLTLYEALVERRVTATQVLQPCFGGYTYGSRRFRCWKPAGHGSVDAVDAMAQSCDTYFYQLGRDLGVEGIWRGGQAFRIAEPTGIDLPGERGGLVPDERWFNEHYTSRGWSGGVALNLSIGQGEILLSPLELAVFAGTIATGGTRVVPHLVSRGAGSDPPAPHRLELLASALQPVRDGMAAAVDHGTARVVDFPEVTVAAKTGTAENAGKDHAAFIAYAPVENPKIALAVYLEHRGHGGAAAGPVARDIFIHFFGLDDTTRVAVGATD